MLNGDVLTDLDLTAQIAQHEASGARATLALTPVEDPRPTGSCGSAPSLVRRVSSRSPDGGDRHGRRLRRAYVLESSVLDLLAPGKTCRSSARCCRGSRCGLRGYPAKAIGWTSGRPSAYLQGTADVLAGPVATVR